jgi:hypothetical protein
MKTLLKILMGIMDGVDWLSCPEGWQDEETQTWHEGEGFDR